MWRKILIEGLRSGAILESKDKEGRVWRMAIIEEGWSKNSRYYPGSTLKESLPLFEGSRVYAYKFKPGHWDHLPDNAREVDSFAKDVSGWLEKCKWERISNGRRAITADFHVTDEKIRETLRNAWEDGKPDFLGFSIDVEGEVKEGTAEGKTGEIVTRVDAVRSVDLVSLPAAGGKLLRLVASQRKGENMDPIKEIVKLLRADPSLLTAFGMKEDVDVEKMSDKDVAGLVVEALKKAMSVKNEKETEVSEADLAEVMVQPGILEKVVELLKGKKVEEALDVLQGLMTAFAKGKGYKKDYKKPEEEEKKEAAAKKKKDEEEEEKKKKAKKEAEEKAAAEKDAMKAATLAQKRADEAFSEAKRIRFEATLDSKLSESKLPEPAKVKLRERFAEATVAPDDLQKAIDGEMDYLATIAPETVKVVKGDGVQTGLTEGERLQKSLDLLVGGEPTTDEGRKAATGIPRFEGLRHAYIVFTKDKEVRGRLSEAVLREATSADFPQALGVSMERRMIAEYKELPQDWRKFTLIDDPKNFKTQDLIRWGGFGQLEEVPEDEAYPTIARFSEETASYAVTTKGGIFQISRRMVINDDLRALRRVPRKLARAANNTLSQFVYDLLMNYTVVGGINAGTIYTGGALYTAGQNNLAATAASWDAVNAMYDRMLKQTELDSGDPIQMMPKFLIYPVDLRATMESIVLSKVFPGKTNDETNTMYKRVVLIMVQGFLRDTNNFYMAADPKDIETITIGFLNGRQDPEILVQDQATVAEVFSHDRIKYKVRHEYNGVQEDFRALQANIVAGS